MRRLLILISLCFFTFGSYAQGVLKQQIDPQVIYGKLDNGLTYYIRHNSLPEKQANFYIVQKVGSMQEEESQRGLAHFLEHMAFNGSKNFPGRKTMTDYLERNGAKFGENVNAYTSYDETVYNLDNVPMLREGVLDSCLLILHDWSGSLTLDGDEIDKERSIIKEEWRTRTGASMRMLDQTFPVVFKGSKYASRSPIGIMEVVENFPYDTLRSYYHKWYRPDLQAIIVVGDIDAKLVEAKIKTMFADIPKPVNPAPRVYFTVPENKKPLLSIVTDPEETSTSVFLYFKKPVLADSILQSDRNMYFAFVRGAVGNMLSNRFTEQALKPESPFTRAGASYGKFLQIAKTVDVFSLGASVKEGRSAEAFKAMAEELYRADKYGFTAAEYERFKSVMLASLERMNNNKNKQNSAGYVKEYVSSFTEDTPIPGFDYQYPVYKQIIMNTPLSAINAYMKTLVSDKNIVIMVLGPRKTDLNYPQEKELLTVLKNAGKAKLAPYTEKVLSSNLINDLPAPGSIVRSEFDSLYTATVWTLSNGIQVVLKKTDFKDDEILMSSISKGGTFQFPDSLQFEKAGIANVPGIGGVGGFSSSELNKVLAGKNARVGVSASRYSHSVMGSSTIGDVETMLELTYLYVTSPRKDEAVFSVAKEHTKATIKNAAADPNTAYGDTVSFAKYGNDPRVKKLTEADVDNLNYDRIVHMYKECFAKSDSMVFVFVGSVDEEKMRPLVEKYLAVLPVSPFETIKDTNPLEIRKGRYVKHFEHKMENPKASVYNQYSGTLKRSTKTALSLSILKQALDMVYMVAVRENEGGTYGVQLDARIGSEPKGQTSLVIFYDTDPAKFEVLNKIIEKELKNIAENGPDEADFLKVKEFMKKQYQETIKTNRYWLSLLRSYYFNKGVDNDDSAGDEIVVGKKETYLSVLESITPDDIKELTRELLSQDNVIEVVMYPKVQ